MNNDARGGSMPPLENAWHGHQGVGLHPTVTLPGPQGQQGQEQMWQGQQYLGLHPIMTLPGPQGQQGQSIIPGPSGGRQMPMTGPQGQQGVRVSTAVQPNQTGNSYTDCG
jgi:hypothetical protein